MNKFTLIIRTPEGIAFEGNVESVVVAGLDGYFGIMAKHAPMIGAVAAGVLRFQSAADESFFVVGEGIIEVGGNRAVVLADAAIPAKHQADAKEKLAAYEKAVSATFISRIAPQ